MKDIGVVIVTFNSSSHIRDCLDSLLIKNLKNINKVVIVDNNSDDNTVDIIKKNFPQIEFIKNSSNLGYAKAVNIGMKKLNENYCLIANPDTVFKSSSLNYLKNTIHSDNTIAIVGGQQTYGGNIWQRSYGNYPGIMDALLNLFFITSVSNLYKRLKLKYSINNKTKYVNYVDGGAMLVRNKAFKQVDGFKEDYFFYAEEADFAYRLKKRKWKIVFEPKALIHHIRGGSSTKLNEKTAYFQELLVKSKMLFLELNTPRASIKLYIFIEYLHSLKMFLLYRIIFGISQDKKYYTKAELFKNFLKIWKQKLYHQFK